VSSSGWSLAIDFGTSNTTAAMAADGAAPVVLEVENSRYLPSAVFVSETGEILTGRSAVRQAAVFPERAERVPKRALVSGTDVVLGDRTVPVTDLVSAVLDRMHSEAVRFHGGQPPDRVVLTHPARWGDKLLERLREAAVAAGIDDPELLAEPVAAAWWYARPSAGSLLGVFDLGGGTLDTAVLRASGEGFAIAGPPGGDAHLGGEDFDELLLAWIGDLARERDRGTWQDAFTGQSLRSRRDRALLRADVTSAKEALSDYLTYDLAVMGYAEGFRVTRRDLEELVAAAVDAAVVQMRQTIAAAGVQPGELAAIYLTGGTSRMPVVGARLAAGLEVVPQMRDDPKAVVALGALTARVVPPSRQPPPAPGPHPAKGGSASVPRPPSDAPPVAETAAQSRVRADRLLAGYHYAGAEAGYRDAIRANAGLAEAHAGLAAALQRQGRDAEAAAAAAEAVRLAPSLAVGHAQLGIALGGLRRDAEAVEACREALRLDQTQPDALTGLAAALIQLGRYGEARGTLKKLAAPPGDVLALRAAIEQGKLHMAEGSHAPARAAFQRVADSGNLDRAPEGVMYLGALLRRQRDFTAARIAYQIAIESRHPRYACGALASLGAMLIERNDFAGARAAYQSAISTADQALAPLGAYLLGGLLGDPGTDQHDAAGERDAFERAIESGHPDTAPRAACDFGRLLRGRGDRAGARAHLERAIMSGHPEYCPQAAYELGGMLREQQDVTAARAVYERVLTSGHALAAQAAVDLGDMLRGQDDQAGARHAYQQAAESPRSYKDPAWAYQFGVKLARQGDTDLARSAFLHAGDSGQPTVYRELAAIAVAHLSRLRDDLNGPDGTITIANRKSRLSKFAAISVDVDEPPQHVLVGEGEEASCTVAPGPHCLSGSLPAVKIPAAKVPAARFIVYVPAGQDVRVSCRPTVTGVSFLLSD